MNPAGIFVLGATHHRAAIELREKLALGSEDIAVLHRQLSALAGLREFAVLSTCNRTEFYGVAADFGAVAEVQAAFCARRRFDPAVFEKIRLELRGRDALQHLLEVAVGLDSQMIGETEIFGQVKEAYADAQTRRSTGPVLNRVFQKAFQAAKEARSATAITVGQLSVANVAVELALSIFGSLGTARILLLGAGEIGEKTARAFQSRGAASLTVASRRLERAMDLATRMGASALPFEQRESRLGEFDIVVCATGATEPVVTLADATAAMRKRPALPLFLVDLSLPRNVEAAAAGLQNVFLYNLDDLSKIADENRAAREAEVTRCRALLCQRSALLWRQIERQLAGRGPMADDGLRAAVSLASNGLKERGPARLPTPPP